MLDVFWFRGPNWVQVGSKIDHKLNQKSIDFCWSHFDLIFIDFGGFSRPTWRQVGFLNFAGNSFGESWCLLAPKSPPDPPKSAPRTNFCRILMDLRWIFNRFLLIFDWFVLWFFDWFFVGILASRLVGFLACWLVGLLVCCWFLAILAQARWRGRACALV